MYRILIVDDEPYIADGVYNYLISNYGEQYDLYKAYSTGEALEKLAQAKFDIVLSDICMPGLDGLELLKKIKKLWPQCMVVFMSGYNQFEYIYEAVKNGMTDYVLKADGHPAIDESIKKAVKIIEENSQKENILNQSRERLKQAAAVLRKEYISSLLYGSGELDGATFKELEIAMDPEQPLFFLLGFTDYTTGKPFEHSKDGYIITGIMEEVLGKEIKSLFADVDPMYYVWLLQPCTGGEFSKDSDGWFARANVFIKGMLENIQQLCKSMIHIDISFFLGSQPVFFSKLESTFTYLKQLFSQYLWLEKPFIVTESKEVIRKNSLNLINYDKTGLMNSNKLKLLDPYLKSGNRKEFRKLLDDVTAELTEIKSMHNPKAVEYYFNISIALLSHINSAELMERLAFKISIWKLFRLEEHKTWLDALDYIRQVAEAIFEEMQQEQKVNAQRTVEFLQKYINEHISFDLSLVCLAEIVHFNPVYLSRFYKQETGRTLSEYITSVRINEAKKLLQTNSLKIHEVAEILGYESAAYFTYVFKKEMGLSPQQYISTCMDNSHT